MTAPENSSREDTKNQNLAERPNGVDAKKTLLKWNENFIEKKNAITYISQNSNKCSRTVNNGNMCATQKSKTIKQKLSRTQGTHYSPFKNIRQIERTGKNAFNFVDHKLCKSLIPYRKFAVQPLLASSSVRSCLYE